MDKTSKRREAILLLEEFDDSLQEALKGENVTKGDLIRLREKFSRLRENLDKKYKVNLAYELEVIDSSIMRMRPLSSVDSPDLLIEIDKRLEEIFNYFTYDRRGGEI